MKETTIAASEFKAKCLSIFDKIAKTGETVVVTKRGVPVAKVGPAEPKYLPLMGGWKGHVKILGDLIDLGTEDDYEEDKNLISRKTRPRKSA